MIRKITLTLVALFCVGALSAQTLQNAKQFSDNSQLDVRGGKTMKNQKVNPVVTKAKGVLDESFEGMTFPPLGWSSIDADGDGNNWMISQDFPYSNMQCAMSESYRNFVGAFMPTNYLITPGLIVSSATDSISYYIGTADLNYPAEKYYVLLSSTGTAAVDFTDTLFNETLSIADTAYNYRALDLSAYQGDTVFVAFVHTEVTDMYQLLLDDVKGPNVYIQDDKSVDMILSYSKLPIPYGAPHQVKAVVTNSSANVANNFDVTLNISGTNTFTDVQTISLNSGETDTVTFAAYTPATIGTDVLEVSIVADDNTANDSYTWSQEVTNTTFSYATTDPAASNVGFNDGEGMMFIKCELQQGAAITGAKVSVSGGTTLNQQIAGVVCDMAGNVLALGSPVTIAAADTGNYVLLPIPSYNVTAAQDVLIGFAQIAGTGGYFPLNYQAEAPARPNTFFYIPGLTGGTPVETVDFGRFMIEGMVDASLTDDIMVVDMTEPVDGYALTNAETVKAIVRNNGTNDITAFDISFKVDNGTAVTENVTQTIAAGATYTYTFTAAADLSAVGAHVIEIEVNMTGDQAAGNNLKAFNVENIAPLAVFPIKMGFEANESLEGWTIVDNNMDNTTWTPIEQGQNPNNGTGYIYCPTPGVDDYLVTPGIQFDASITYVVSFWYKTRPGGTEAIECLLGNSQDVSSFTTTIIDLPNIKNDAYQLVLDTIPVPSSGIYFVAFKANGASSSQTVYIDDIMIDDWYVGLEEVNVNKTVKMFPNPAQDFVALSAISSDIENVRVYNSLGQLVMDVEANEKTTTLNIAGLQKGFYTVQIKTENGTAVKKLNIVR